MARSLNRAELIGNLTKDAELRFTQQGTAVCSFVVATDRSWTTDSGEKKEQVDFHRVIAWNKLAELCNQLLKKSDKVYVAGRIANRSYEKDGEQRQISEIIIDNMILLNSKQRPPQEPQESREPKIPETPKEVAEDTKLEEVKPIQEVKEEK